MAYATTAAATATPAFAQAALALPPRDEWRRRRRRHRLVRLLEEAGRLLQTVEGEVLRARLGSTPGS